MNEYQNYGEENGRQDYYEQYTEEKIREARGVFSRYHLGLFAYTAVAYAVAILAEVLIILILGKGKMSELYENIYFQWLLGVGPMYIVGFPIFFLITKNMKKRTYKKEKMGVGEFLTLFLVSQGVMIVGNVIGTALNSFIGAIIGRDIANSTSDLIENSPVWLITLVAVIIGPIIEEMMFRKMMIDRLGVYGDKIAIIVSAVAFGLFHGNFYQFFYAAMLGMVLGYVYTKTGNTLYNTALHMIINFFGSVAVLPIMKISERFAETAEKFQAGADIDYLSLIQDFTVIYSYSLVQYLTAIAGVVILIYAFSKRKIKINKECEYIIPRERVGGVVFGNVGVIIFLIASFVIFGINIFGIAF